MNMGHSKLDLQTKAFLSKQQCHTWITDLHCVLQVYRRTVQIESAHRKDHARLSDEAAALKRRGGYGVFMSPPHDNWQGH